MQTLPGEQPDVPASSARACSGSEPHFESRSHAQVEMAPLISDEAAACHPVRPLETSGTRDDNYLPTGDARPNTSTPADLVDFDELILRYMREQHIPGLSLAISSKGRMIYTQCYGYATHGVPLRPHHLLRIASVSKVVTAIGVLRLCEQGRLSLRSRIFGPKGVLSEHRPAVGGDRRLLRVTVRCLLQHSGGWDRDVAGDPVFYKHVGKEMGVPEPVDQHTLIRYMMGKKLQFTPGSKYAYSNLGYVILGRVIERTSGLSYEAYIQTILSEIGITRVQLGRSMKHQAHPDEVEYFATAKARSVDSVFPGQGKVLAPYGGYCMETGDADGGWIACPRDLVRLAHCLEGLGGAPRVLGPDTFKIMLDKPAYAKGCGYSCWYGLGVDVSWARRAWEHGGHIDGATGCLVRDRHGFCWSVLCNYWPADSDYTSLIAYGISHVKAWSGALSSAAIPTIPGTDGATKDGNYAINIQVPHEDYHIISEQLIQQGYRPAWINGYQVQSQTYFNLIWIKDPQPSLCYRDLTLGLFVHQFKAIVSNGYRPCHIDTYYVQGEVRFAVIFLYTSDTSPSWILHHDLDIGELAKTTLDLKTEGYTLKILCPYRIGSRSLACVFFEKVGGLEAWFKHGLTEEKYQAEFDRQRRYGHLLAYVKCYVQPDNYRESELHEGELQCKRQKIDRLVTMDSLAGVDTVPLLQSDLCRSSVDGNQTKAKLPGCLRNAEGVLLPCEQLDLQEADCQCPAEGITGSAAGAIIIQDDSREPLLIDKSSPLPPSPAVGTHTSPDASSGEVRKDVIHISEDNEGTLSEAVHAEEIRDELSSAGGHAERADSGAAIDMIDEHHDRSSGPEVLFSAIWTNPGAFLYTAEHDLSKYRLLNDLQFAADKAFTPSCISGYEGEEGGHKFVAVCTKRVPRKN